MIIKTLYYRAGGSGSVVARLMWYVQKKTAQNKREYRTLYWGSGLPVSPENLYVMERQYQRAGMTRMIIFSPLDYRDPENLWRQTRDTMLEYIKYRGLYTTRFVYGLHYNTMHPHSHVIVTAYYPRELAYTKGHIFTLQKIAERVFDEPVGVSAYAVRVKRAQQRDKERDVSFGDIEDLLKRKASTIEKELKEEKEDIEREAPEDLTMDDFVDQMLSLSRF